NPYSDAVSSAASRAPATADLLPSANLGKHGTPGEDEYRENAEQQRALDGPYGRHRSDLRDDRVAAERDLVLRAVGAGHGVSMRNSDAHHDQRQDRDPGIRQFLLFERFRLVHENRAVPFSAFCPARRRFSI